MVPYSLTPPSMKGLLLDANPPVVLRPPVCPRSGFRHLVVLLPGEPGPHHGDSTTAPGAPLKLLSMSATRAGSSSHPGLPLAKLCWRPSERNPLSTALGLAFQVVPSLPFLSRTKPGLSISSRPSPVRNLLLPPLALAIIPAFSIRSPAS